MTAAATSDVFEMTLLMSVAGASTLLNFVSQERLHVVIARRMFTILNLLMAIVVSFRVDAAHVSRYVLAVLGPTILNALLTTLMSVLPRDDGSSVHKRSS